MLNVYVVVYVENREERTCILEISLMASSVGDAKRAAQKEWSSGPYHAMPFQFADIYLQHTDGQRTWLAQMDTNEPF